MGAVYRREVGAFFTSSIAYVFLSVFYIYSGIFFYSSTLASSTSDMAGLFNVVFIAILILIPILTMRLLSEEKKQKTEQCLLTAPLSLPGMVAGKFFAALTLYSIGISIFFIYGLILSYFGNVAWTMLFSNILALFLVGASFIAIGIFISSLTESQIVAAIVSILVLIFLFIIDMLATTIIKIDFIKEILLSISFYTKYQEFTSGIFNLSSVLFYISTAVIFLFLTVRIYERRRWS